MIKKILIGIVVAFILLLIIGAIFGDDTTDSTTNSEVSSSASAEPAELIAVTARELFTAYDKNEVAADKQFKGKMLEVTATVSSIDSGFSDDAVVQLNTGNDFQTVSAQGDETFTDIASTLNKGQEVTMICQGAGEIIGSPMLDNCVIQ